MNFNIDNNLILNTLEQNIFVKDINSTYLFVNTTYAKLVGEDANSIIGKNDLDFFPKEIADKYRDDDSLVIQNEQVIDTIEPILIDGEYRTIRTVKKPLYSNGDVIAVLGIFWDITDFNEEKENLKKLEYGLNKAQELANIGHWELNLATNDLFWSDEVYRIFGLQPQEFGATYEAFLEYIHPDDVDLVNRSYTDSVAGKRGYHVTHRIVRKNGEIGFVEERCEHEFDIEGNVTRSIGTVHDITKQKIAQNELMLASEVFSKMSDGVVITDANQKIIKVNEAFTKITGYTTEELEGNTPKAFSSGWHDEAFYQKMWDDINHHGQWNGEIIDRKKNSERYTAEMHIIALHNDEGTLTNYISITNDISKKKEQEKLIHNLAYFDALTELPNRVLFEERVVSRMPFTKRNDKKMALIFIDMDNFKNVNDTLGHFMGDIFLIEVANTIKETLREQDTLARLGGDEFTILVEDINSIMDVIPIAEKIIASFKKPIMIEEKEIYTGVSIGVSIYPDDGESYDELVKAADTAMYQVKASGKNNFQFYTQTMNEKITERLFLEDGLRNAVSNNEIFIVYQPKVNLETKKVYGMEALARWKHPELGLVRPDKFIAISEETGQIYNLGLWIAKQALIDTKALHEVGHRLTVSINVSSKQLEKESFIDDICSLVNEIGIDKSYVELEITESHIMSNIDKALIILKELSSKGFKLSIDDFGTGYSSLSYLKKLPAQTIKIDRSFVLDIDKDEDDRSIVATIIAMASALGKDVIAEGSETQEHIDTLKYLHCNKVQGYFFSKPIEIGEFREFVDNF
ncbi:EAL domain-containing protein [Sulfurimonas sp.]|uniref:sensor domain-containing protein n=1 Tax=Sulfurimonas sp. TaxID=2022749 RepID=UPI0035685515